MVLVIPAGPITLPNQVGKTVQQKIELSRALRDELRKRIHTLPRPDQGFNRPKDMILGPDGPRITDKRNHLTLVQAEYLFKTGKLPQQGWEAFNYLYRQACWYGWDWLQDCYKSLMDISPSVEGFGAANLVAAMQGQKELKDPAAKYQEPVKVERGL